MCVSQGSVVDFCGDAVVNAANNGNMLHISNGSLRNYAFLGGISGGGVDAAITGSETSSTVFPIAYIWACCSAGGPQLKSARQALGLEPSGNRIETGSAKITTGMLDSRVLF